MKAKTKFIHTNNQKEYVVSLKKSKLWWIWLILFLFLFLLLIPFKKNILVIDLENKTQTKLVLTDTYLKYVDYQFFNFKTTKFFTHDTIELFRVSDSNAVAKFENIRYTLYSRIFFINKKAYISAVNECMYGDSLRAFHKLKNNKIFKLYLDDKVYNYTFTILNSEDGQPIPNANVKLVSNKNGNIKIFDAVSQPDGTVYFEGVPYCGNFKVFAGANGYNPDSVEADSRELYYNDSLKNLYLSPEKQSIHFFVKDLYSRQPLSDATAELIINGQVVQTVKTNVNGYATAPGEGVFENVSVDRDFTIHAYKDFYNDTTKSDNVVHWIVLPDSSKTLYLRPKKNSIQFRDIDGNVGIAGAKNIIYVNGKPQANPVYSNSDGYFTVAGVSPDDKISIVASKPGYETNDYTIKNRKMSDLLKANQEQMNIPLNKRRQPTPPPKPLPKPDNDNNIPPPPPGVKVLPCEQPQESGGQGVTTKVHSLGNSYKFTITWNMYNVPDQLIIYCGTGADKKKIFSTHGAVSGRGTATLFCKKHYITVTVVGAQEGTQWSYKMNCQ